MVNLPGGAGLSPEIVTGDECRILAETPPGTPHPDYYSGFEFIATEGAHWRITDLQCTPACAPESLSLTPTPGGFVITWPGDSSRLQGAESPAGPWFDLGAVSPVTLGQNHAARFFRLACE